MNDRLLKESDVLKIAFQLPLVVNSAFYDAVKALPSADNEIIGKLKTAIENEEICKNCPTAERITGENLLGAMALGFSYGMEADRPQGEWIEIGTISHSYKCSVCGRTLFHITVGKNHVAKYYPYCHCGAKMKGADE